MNAISWAHPALALAVVPGFVALLLLRWAWGAVLRRRQRGIGVTAPALHRGYRPGLARLRAALLALGLAAGVVALLGPRWGEAPVERTARGANLLLLLDCSRSMLADDLHPNRIEAARRKALDLLDAAPQHRMALMPFAARAVLRCPLTGDRHALHSLLDDCGPDLFPAADGLQGTAIGDAVIDAIELLTDRGDRGRAIVIMSDGSDDDRERVVEAATRARSAGIPVFGLFLGDPAVEATLRIDGVDRVMTSDRSTLDTLAERTGGLSVSATNDRADVATLAEDIADKVTMLPWKERSRVMASERYRYPLLAAIVLIALAGLTPTRSPRRDPV